MIDKEKQIEEIAIGVCEYRKARGYKKCDDCDWGGECGVTEYARELYDAGYRKQSEVAKEFVDRLILELIALRSEEFDGKELAINGKTYKYLVMRAKEIAAEYGVEVEK